jgi:hypothetical protein
MRDLTVIMAYYENPMMLEHQLENFAAMSEDIRKHLTYIIVDDCSPQHPALEVVNSCNAWCRFKVKLFRMKVDIAWNQDACRNLGVSQTKDEWFLLTDMDHLPPEQTILAAMTEKLDKNTFYPLSRLSAPDYSPYKPHPNSYLMHQSVYFKVGGYDERWAGVYGTDGAFRSRLNQKATNQFFPYPLIRYPREVLADASTTTYERRSEENSRLKDEVGARIRQEGGPPHTGLFEWEQQL